MSNVSALPKDTTIEGLEESNPFPLQLGGIHCIRALNACTGYDRFEVFVFYTNKAKF